MTKARPNGLSKGGRTMSFLSCLIMYYSVHKNGKKQHLHISSLCSPKIYDTTLSSLTMKHMLLLVWCNQK
jgi:hypothetical protein